MWERLMLLTSNIWQFVRPAVLMLLTETGKALAAAAITAVQQAQANPNLSGAQKRAQAAASIKADMERASYSVAESAINVTLEMALQKLKAEPAPASVF